MGKEAKGELDTLIAALHQLSDATRLRLLFLLGSGEKNVTDLCDALRCNQPTCSHHLGLLRMAGMVDTRRDGKRVFYRLAVPAPRPATIRVAAGAGTVEVRPR